MFDKCWASVVDGGTTLVQHWVDVSCLLGMGSRIAFPIGLYFNVVMSVTMCSPLFEPDLIDMKVEEKAIPTS